MAVSYSLLKHEWKSQTVILPTELQGHFKLKLAFCEIYEWSLLEN